MINSGYTTCYCECHKYPGTYPPPCHYCGHDTRFGHMVGSHYEGWRKCEDINCPRHGEIVRFENMHFYNNKKDTK